MNRNYGHLLFFSAGLFLAGCSSHSGSSDGAVVTPLPPAPTSVDLTAFVRSGIADPESGEPRVVNDVPFTTSELDGQFDDWF